MGNPWIGPDKRDKERSEIGVLSRKLDGEGGEDQVEVAPVLEIPGAEEGGTELSTRERPLRNCLCDGCLPRSGQPIQPVDGRFVEVPSPVFNGIQNSPARPLEAPVAVTMSILGPLCTAEVVEDSRLG